MNEYIQKQFYPCLVFFLTKNPEYGKIHTMETMTKPSEELYRYYMDDYLTLGRPIPKYEEWAQRYMELELERLQRISQCGLSADKVSVQRFEDIGDIINREGFVRFIRDELNEHFGIVHK